jgi:SAM-dependent methyltransferase
MLRHEYQTLYELEGSYWWFRALRGILLDVCEKLGLDQRSRVLDAGCGTGHTVGFMRDHLTRRTHGFDVSPVAANYWGRAGLTGLWLGSINSVPCRDGYFDAVVAVDVLESDGVLECEALSELCRVVRAGGWLILVIPAYKWMMTPEHHEAVAASRRYTRNSAARLLDGLPVRVVRSTHLFTSLFIPIAVYRLWQRLSRFGRVEVADALPRSELRQLAPGLNGFLAAVMNVERRVLGFIDLPVGSSILLVAEKRGK